MSSKMNQRITYLMNIGLLISSFTAYDVAASTECGQAKLVQAGSTGVNVMNNTCAESSRITLGSTLELSAGSRMWLKFDTNAKGESFQLICQNKSADKVSVNISSTVTPWIKPQGLQNCETWKSNKLSCNSSSGEKNSFFCAIASAKLEKVAAVPEATTSVKMRGIPGLPSPIIYVDNIVETIEPDILLCKKLYDVTEPLEMSWKIASGDITDLTVNSTHKDLVDCVEGVVKQANLQKDDFVHHSF
jgi:hypothetical protein